jgi:hypothetical protein
MNRGIVFLSPIIGIFDTHGMKRVENTRVIGTSGVEQIFDACFEGDGRKIYIDIVQGKEPFGELDILREYGKIVDSKVDAWTLIAPSLDGNALAMSNSYKMNVIYGTTPNEIHNKLETVLKSKGIISQPTKDSSKTAPQESIKEKEKPKSRWKI